MAQVLLIVVGIYLLAKGTVKVSSDRELSRPGSTYLGIVLLVYGAGIQFVDDRLVSSIVYFVSLVAVAFFFVHRFGAKKESLSGDGKETMRNLAILLTFLAVLGVVSYLYFKSLQEDVITPERLTSLSEVEKPAMNSFSDVAFVSSDTAKEERTDVRYKGSALHTFVYQKSQSRNEYSVKYLSGKFLVIEQSGFPAQFLFDVVNLKPIALQFQAGTIVISEDEKYIAAVGPGRVSQSGISIELINGKKVHCILTEEDVAGVKFSGDTVSFTESAIVVDEENVGKNVVSKKEIDILQSCR